MMPMKKTFKDFKMGAPIYMLFRYGKVVFTGQDVPRVFSSEAHYEYNKTRFGRSYLPTDELVKYVPERRGEWIKTTPCSEPECSRCGKCQKLVFGMLPDFCPHCGAKMTKEETL